MAPIERSIPPIRRTKVSAETAIRMTESCRMMFWAFGTEENPSTVSDRIIAARITTGSMGRFRKMPSTEKLGALLRVKPERSPVARPVSIVVLS
jgi:hypothetical protein